MFIHITTTVISDCGGEYYTYWINKRNK
ncbi:type I toxin-antitoxin system Fst family toxin [Staphylococcus epidermidis]|nr:type I toxin-antitoxin system Fst family toxin [Staphylococcus epidermidis]MBM0828968.1 type I toxin-antitoxin system Fst family toxin [Staphylococcus epidermidis]